MRNASSTRRRLPIARVVVVSAMILVALVPGTTLAAPSIQLDPDSGPVGTGVLVTGTGFADGPYLLCWDGTIQLGMTNATDGALTAKFSVPGATDGAHTVGTVAGSLCAFAPVATATFTVGTVSPTPGQTTNPTPRPTRAPTAAPTKVPGTSTPNAATPSPGVIVGPTAVPSPSNGVAIPVPSFPLTGPAPTPSSPAYVAITPAPQPPGDEAAPETEWPNLKIDAIEVTQGIQNLDNDMPLVAGRRTYARVYIDLTGAQSWPNTWGALEARRAGQQIGWIWPENGPIIARAGGGDRTKLDDSLYFRLPSAWLSGNVTLTAFVFSYGIDTPFTREPIATDNTRQELVYFAQGLPLTMHLVPLHMHRSWHPADVERVFYPPALGGVLVGGPDASSVGVTNRIVAGAFRYLPIAQVNVDGLNTAVTPLGHATGHEFDLGGPCRTVLIDGAASNHVEIADWTVLMTDTSGITPGGGANSADRTELRIMDWKFTVSYFYAREDGTGDVWGSSNNVGPTPVAGAPVYAHRCAIMVSADGEPDSVMGLYRGFYDWQDEREVFVGMVHPSLRPQWGGFSRDGTDSVWVRWIDSFGTDDPWLHNGAATLGHETSHAAGLDHVPCKDTNGDDIPDEIVGGDFDLTHPMVLTFPDCWLSEVDTRGYFGFDTYSDRFGLPAPVVLSNDPAQPHPNGAYPNLSYATPGWTDPYHYCRLLSYYGVTCSPTALGLPWNVPPPQPDGSDPYAAVTPPPAPLEDGIDTMSISYQGLEDGSWTMEALARNPEPTAHDEERIAQERRTPPDEALPWLVVLDANGAVEWQAMLPLGARPHEAEGGVIMGDAIVPIRPGSSAIEIRSWDAEVQARVEASEGLPEIAGLFKDTADGETIEPDGEILVRFEGRDPDPDTRIRYFLLYSPDRERWQLVAATEGGEVPAPTRDLPSGEDPTFKLVAFDGWNVAEEILPAPELAAPRNGPTVLILATEPRRYPLQAQVRLEASAFDLEDRALPGESIRWSSSLDGDLGSGAELATRALSAGRHVLTASATDSDGLEGSASYELEIDGSIVEAVPGEDVDAEMARIFAAIADGEDPAPDGQNRVHHPDFPWLPVAIGGAIALAGLALGGAAWLRGRRAAAAGAATLSYPISGWQPITGDWDGDAPAAGDPEKPPEATPSDAGQSDAEG